MCYPKLEWENPIAAFKQNFTTMIGLFITMGVVAILVVIGIFIPWKTPTLITSVSAVLTIIAILYWKIFMNYAESKLRSRF